MTKKEQKKLAELLQDVLDHDFVDGPRAVKLEKAIRKLEQA